jgi:uncharacterized protein YndB with AHSA1/START domain
LKKLSLSVLSVKSVYEKVIELRNTLFWIEAFRFGLFLPARRPFTGDHSSQLDLQYASLATGMEKMNTSTISPDQKRFNKVIQINAPPSRVWHVLTTPEWMNRWMMPDAELKIITGWQVAGPILIRGQMNGKDFENRGTVVKFEPGRALEYTHLSSISRLPDRAESYVSIDFRLEPLGDQTTLELTLSNFPNESICKHMVFYWNVTLEILRRLIEEQA